MLKWSPTTPAGRPSLSFSYSKMLNDFPGVLVQTAVVSISVHPDSASPDATPNARLDGNCVVSADGKTVSQFFKTGLAGVDYILTCLATYSDGQKEPIDGVLQVRTFNDVGT